MTTILWYQNYHKDELNDDDNENNTARIKKNNNKTITSKSFEYSTINSDNTKQ